MKAQTRWLLIVGAGILVGLILLFGVLLLLVFFSFGPMTVRFPPFLRRFESNGQRIYFTGMSESGEPITAEIPGMHRMPGGSLACANCHGPDGQGEAVQMMMGTFVAPDIRYRTLISEAHDQGDEEHPPYTEETLKRAITEGIDPAGEPLSWPMPRWRMSDRDLNDLIDFLKTLE